MIVIWTGDTVLADELKLLDTFAEHVRPVAVLYNGEDVAHITEDMKQKYSVLECFAVKTGKIVILQKGDFGST